MAKSHKQERQHSPAEVCRLFDLNRTTLFRWEDEGKIPPAERDLKDQRVYRQTHLESLAKLTRNKIRRDIENVFKHDPDNKATFWNVLERLYLLEMVCQAEPWHEPWHAVEQLRGLVVHRPLQHKTADFLIEAAKLYAAGDPIRERIWQLLVEHEQAVQRGKIKNRKAIM